MIIHTDDRDIFVEDGQVVDHARGEEIDARGLIVLPGLIDVHVHFNEPGHTEWEGAATGSRALAAGGGTVFFDMPLNSLPCTVDAAAFDAKRAALERASVTDFALWGGIVPGNLDRLAELAARGVIGFKAFMADSGLPEFPRADDRTLFDGMREAARLGLPVAVHAENNELIRSSGPYSESRPVVAEVDAIQRASLFARETGAKLHIVHVSSARGLAAALEARAAGTDLSIETCPHYLYFTAADFERLGAILKCAPPLRSERLPLDGIDIVGSDHSPAPPSMKSDPDIFKVWGGVAGVQHTLAVVYELAPDRVADLCASNPAKRFKIAKKGRILPGFDADFALFDPNFDQIVTRESLFQRHGLSPYLGERFRGGVRRTILRGRTIFADGKIITQSCGRMIRHAHA
jgi:allantoinase